MSKEYGARCKKLALEKEGTVTGKKRVNSRNLNREGQGKEGGDCRDERPWRKNNNERTDEKTLKIETMA